MASYYKLSLPIILEYYNVMGLDLTYIDSKNIENEVRDLSELRLDIAYEVLPSSSIKVAEGFESFLDKMCCDFGYDEESLKLKNEYYSSVIGILNAVTSLNLIPSESEDYLLHFERINSILRIVLDEIYYTPTEEVIAFAKLLGEGKVRGLTILTNTLKVTSLLAILALNSNNDIPDYEMFASEESSQIDGEKLISLVKNNLGSKYVKYALHRHTFNRPSYLSCSPSTPQND